MTKSNFSLLAKPKSQSAKRQRPPPKKGVVYFPDFQIPFRFIFQFNFLIRADTELQEARALSFQGGEASKSVGSGGNEVPSPAVPSDCACSENAAVHGYVDPRAENSDHSDCRADVEGRIRVHHFLGAHCTGEHDRFMSDTCREKGSRSISFQNSRVFVSMGLIALE